MPHLRPLINRPGASPRGWAGRRWLARLKRPAAALMLGLGLLPFFALAGCNYPFWDDFGMALMGRELGLGAAQPAFYLTWGGRYTTALVLTALNPLTYNWLGGFRLVPLLLLGGTALALQLSLRELSGQRLGRGAALGGASLLLLLVLAWVPAIYPTFYWFSSGVVYQLALILMLLVAVAGLRALRASSAWGRRGWYALALLGTAAVVGLNEIALLLFNWVLLVLLALSWRQGRRRAAWCWGGLLLCALVGGAVALLAPGNLMRLHGGVPAGRLPLPAGATLEFAAKSLAQFLAAPRQALALVLAPLLLGPLLLRLRAGRPVGFRLPLAWGAGVLLAGLAGCFLFFALISPGTPPPRTLSLIWQWLFLGWLAVLWAAVPARVPGAARVAARWVQRPALLFVGFLLLADVEHRAWAEWLKNGPTWQAQHEARFAALREAGRRGQRSVRVSPFTGFVPRHVSIIGETLYYNPANSAEHNNNSVTARWFGLDSVSLSAPRMPGRISDEL